MNRKFQKRQRTLAIISGIALLGILAIFFAPLLVGLAAAVGTKGVILGGFLAANAPVVLPEAEFQQKVLGAVTTIDTQQQTLIKNYDQLDKDTKKAFEELTKIKENANQVSEVLSSLQKVQTQLRREQRMAFGSPMQRLLGNEDFRARLNCMIRLAVDQHGDMQKRIAPKLKALGEDSSPGSTLITDELATEIYDTLASYGKWNTLGVRQLGTKTTKFPIKTARPTANVILTEGGTIADDTDKAGTTVSLEAEVIAVLLNVALQLIEDAEVDVTGDVMNDFMEAFNYRLDFLAFAADGTADATHGGMTGLFNFGTAANAAAGNISVEKTDLEDWVRCLTTVDEAVLSRNPKWWMHSQILARAILVRDANKRSIFLTATEAPSLGGIGSILGAPVELVSAAPSTNAASAKVAVYGEPNGYVVGIRKSFIFEASDHHKWNTLQRSFRGHGRAGTKGRRATSFAVLTLPAA